MYFERTQISTFEELKSLVDEEENSSEIKQIASAFLAAANDWDTFNQSLVTEFIKELKDHFGTPLTISKIENKKLGRTHGSWKAEAGCSIVEMIKLGETYFKSSDFDFIFNSLMKYYSDRKK